MKKILLFVGFTTVSAIALLVFNDVATLKSYAQKVGATFGYGSAYTEKTVNAIQDSVNSSASAIDDLRENKAKAIIEEQRKKIDEMKKELEKSVKNTEEKIKTEEKI